MDSHIRKIVKITQIVEETNEIKTFRFVDERRALSGQFVMVWVIGVDEIPMSLSYVGVEKGITVKKVGEATTKLHNLRVGDKICVRGPYGNHFTLQNHDTKILAVGGGVGVAVVAPFVENLSEREITAVIGAKTESELLFEDRLSHAVDTVYITTDDGSAGYKGVASELVEELVEKHKYDLIIGCGPELMMKKILLIGLKNNTRVQLSLERYMKCGIGLCDSCSIDGYHVCVDGPIFTGEFLSKIQDFGTYKRDSSGMRIKL